MKIAVECPGCGADVEIEPGRRSAELFCARCDYPLFWVTPPRSPEDGDDTGDMVLRRRPGAAGIRLPATVPCPACRELNLVMEVTCLRCGSPMRPEPEPEPEPVVVPEPRVTSTVRSTGPRNTRRYSPGVGRSPSEYVPSSAGTACRRGSRSLRSRRRASAAVHELAVPDTVPGSPCMGTFTVTGWPTP